MMFKCRISYENENIRRVNKSYNLREIFHYFINIISGKKKYNILYEDSSTLLKIEIKINSRNFKLIKNSTKIKIAGSGHIKSNLINL